jgi:hypothetical protein
MPPCSAKDAAKHKDVRIGGGVATIQQYLRARLIDELHLAFRLSFSEIPNRVVIKEKKSTGGASAFSSMFVDEVCETSPGGNGRVARTSSGCSYGRPQADWRTDLDRHQFATAAPSR